MKWLLKTKKVKIKLIKMNPNGLIIRNEANLLMVLLVRRIISKFKLNIKRWRKGNKWNIKKLQIINWSNSN